MSQPTLYGIANCDTMKKARQWLAARGVDYAFHDYRKQGLPPELLGSIVAALGWEELLNRRGTTWRGLPDEVRQELDERRAIEIMLEQPAIIRRPVLQREDRFYLGFSEARYAEIFDRT